MKTKTISKRRKTPTPQSAKTVERALANLVGAVEAAIEIHFDQLERNKVDMARSKAPPAIIALAHALTQFKNTGLVLKEAKHVKEAVIESYVRSGV